MPVTSTFNTSLLSPLTCYSNSSLYPGIFECFDFTTSSLLFATFTFTNLLFLVPLYMLILWMGYQRWRNQCSAASGTTSHSDVFTYYLVTMEIVSVLGSVFSCCAIFTCSPTMLIVGYHTFSSTYPSQTFFHCLTCVERYMAVVHPITYLGLKKAGGVGVRNIGIGCVFLLCFGLMGLVVLYFPDVPTAPMFSIFTITVTIVSFCSVSVLHALVHPGVRKAGRGREQADRSKRRAFHTILTITGVLVLRSCGLLVCNIIFSLELGGKRDLCVVLMSGLWLCLPSSLILPLLFLQRAGAFACFHHRVNKDET